MHLHEKLGITFRELMALFAVRTMLQHELIQFSGPDPVPAPLPGLHEFNMNVACETKECGSVGCIGGYMAFVMDKNGFSYVNSKNYDPIHSLFYPPNGLRWETIEPHHAVQAIDNFLNTGLPNWDGIEGIEDKDEW